MDNNIVETDRIANELNAAALVLYRTAVIAAPEADRIEQAISACEQAADDAGMLVVETDFNNYGATTVLRDEAGELVNLWTHSPDERATDDDFEGIGFDANLEWYTDRLQQAQDAATEEKRAGRELDRALAAGH
jgi:hypothetical protein